MMTGASFLVGDVFDRLAEIPDGSIDLVLTSPPFLALRSYLPAGHPDKHREIGSEPDPASFVDTMLALTAEWGRVLAPHGSIAVELGDTYSGTGTRTDAEEGRIGRVGFGRDDQGFTGRSSHGAGGGVGWPDAKSACLIPELYRVALAYGRNPLTGDESPAGSWRVRNTVRWVRPNPPVGALGDKYRPATSDMVIACKAKDRWFDLDAVRHDHKYDPATTTGNGYTKGAPAGVGETVPMPSNPAGAPPLDWWNIPTSPYKGSHYATYPMELCRIPILSMVPGEKCAACGTPRRRITGEVRYVDSSTGADRSDDAAGWESAGAHGNRGPNNGRTDWRLTRTAETVGWSDCGCDIPDYQPGTVLDPFAGSGTSLAAAVGHGRNAIGIDLDARNADLARERVGMFLTIDYGDSAA